jgi:CRP-like cAMP-binding protein
VTEKTEEHLSDSVKLFKLLAVGIADNKPQKEQIRLLSLGGLQPTEIAQLLGTTRNSVNVTLSQLRKSKSLRLKSEKRGGTGE